MVDRELLVEKILAAEFDMFRSVATQGPNQCLLYPEAFKLHRKAQFSIFSKEALKSYLDDLQTARENGRNLMTYKYARMDNLIPRENDSLLVEKVAGIMLDWQLRLKDRYPDLMKRARPVSSANDRLQATSFETYLRSELETYSKRTLAFLYRDMKKLKDEGINGSEEIYRFLVQESRYK